MPLRRPARLGAVLATGLTALTTGLLTVVPGGAAVAAHAPSGPDHEMPFPCGDYWNGSTRSSHSPSYWSIDWNREGDLGAMVLSSAPGVVTSVVDLGSRSYGRYVVVDHGSGHSTLYAHLNAFWAVEGQAVDQGTPLGLLGSSGGSTGPHLHFEERLNRSDIVPYFTRQHFVMGTTLASSNCSDAPVIGDWDNNGTSNIGIQRRGTTPKFYLKRPGQKAAGVVYGWRTDQALSGDWDGDGDDELGVRRPGLRSFFLRRDNGPDTAIRLGAISDFGLAGDWNGDRRTDVGTWSPGTRTFTLRTASGSTRSFTFGSLGDRPVTGDWNGDGRSDVGVFTPGTATFTLRTETSAGSVSARSFRYGSGTDLPVAGDWNADGIGDVGVWSPSTALFHLRVSSKTGTTSSEIRTPRYGVPRG